MNEQQQSITPPPELVQQWRNTAPPFGLNRESWIAAQAVRWGANQELEACCQALFDRYVIPTCIPPKVAEEMRDWLRAVRRPQAPSLADGPAVPQGREPAAVITEPSDEEWDALVERVWDKYETVGYQGERFMYDGDFGSALDLVRKELSRWGHQPAPPADGEVAKLVAELRRLAPQNPLGTADPTITRAADLLERLIPPQPPADGEVAELVRTMRMEVAAWNDNESATYWLSGPEIARIANLLERLSPPQPVPVGERPWEREEWCDTDGLCWLGSHALDGSTPTWLFGPPAWAERFPTVHRVLLPAHALPLPEVGS